MASGTSTVSYRSGTRDDLHAIIGLYNWAVNQTFATIDSEPLSPEEAVGWWDAHGRRTPLLVAEEDGDVIGWARLMPWRQRGYDVVEDLVYVDPVHHGRGIARELLSRLIEEGKGLGDCRTIVASVATDNQSGLKLHLSLGFEVVGTIKAAAYKFERWMDITLMQRQLDI